MEEHFFSEDTYVRSFKFDSHQMESFRGYLSGLRKIGWEIAARRGQEIYHFKNERVMIQDHHVAVSPSVNENLVQTIDAIKSAVIIHGR
ncbi:MAG: hypothetical protein AABY22_11915 [Nanoarchaeota archaeon]